MSCSCEARGEEIKTTDPDLTRFAEPGDNLRMKANKRTLSLHKRYSTHMAYEIEVSDEFYAWYEPLSESEQTGDGRWYEVHVPKAEAIYAEHLKELEKAP